MNGMPLAIMSGVGVIRWEADATKDGEVDVNDRTSEGEGSTAS